MGCDFINNTDDQGPLLLMNNMFNFNSNMAK